MRPASSPSTETGVLLAFLHTPQVGGAVLQLERLGDLERGLEADRDIVGHVVAAHRQDGRVERRAVVEQREVDGPGPDVRDRDPQLLLRLGQDRLRGGERSSRPARRT